jgi:hypothetical protein
MVEIAIFSISLMAYIPCAGNDTPETNTWLNLQKIGYSVEVKIKKLKTITNHFLRENFFEFV